jgi:hypothetical protein
MASQGVLLDANQSDTFTCIVSCINMYGYLFTNYAFLHAISTRIFASYMLEFKNYLNVYTK